MANRDGTCRHHRGAGAGHGLGAQRGLFSLPSSTTPTTRCSSASRSPAAARGIGRSRCRAGSTPPTAALPASSSSRSTPYYLARFYETVDLGPSGTVMLVGRDGVVRVRVSFAPDQTHPERRSRPVITIGETVIAQADRRTSTARPRTRKPARQRLARHQLRRPPRFPADRRRRARRRGSVRRVLCRQAGG